MPESENGKKKQKAIAKPFVEEGTIVECNKDILTTMDLDQKKYRVTRKGAKYQTYIFATYRDEVKIGNTITGVGPIVRQQTFRIDDDRPVNDDGSEKKPWNTDYDFSLVPVVEDIMGQIRKAHPAYFKNSKS